MSDLLYMDPLLLWQKLALIKVDINVCYGGIKKKSKAHSARPGASRRGSLRSDKPFLYWSQHMLLSVLWAEKLREM